MSKGEEKTGDSTGIGTPGGGPDEILTKSVEYHGVLRSMRSGSVTRSEVEEIADVSSSTAHRILSSLIDNGLVEKRKNREYVPTPLGEEIIQEVRGFRENTETATRLNQILESAESEGVDFDPRYFSEGEVVVSSPEEPYGPARRFMEVFRETDSLRLLVVSTSSPMFSEEKQKLIAEGRETEVVCPRSIVEATMETIPKEIIEDMMRNLTVHVHDEPPFSVALFDDRVGVGGHDREKGTLEVFADTENEEAYEWGEEIYERYLEESDRMFERFDIEEVIEHLNFDAEEYLDLEQGDVQTEL
ncbi:MAG: helix-turn-helix domain-containing protein, partial [Halobacteria archaeon]|nr:helix-turn-helix domain-containing protein [Halobacteria archaeon]